MRQQHWANSGERIHLAILARQIDVQAFELATGFEPRIVKYRTQIDVQAFELATGFEPRIVKYRTMFRRFTCNMQPSRRAT